MSQLIIYFSLSNRTKQAAEKIQKITDADIIRLQPKKPYPKEYSDYSVVGMNEFEQNIHPEIKTTFSDLSDYDVIYLGYPTWNGQVPMIFHTLFEQFDFSNKTIVPFTTSASSSMTESLPYLKKIAVKDEVVSGFRYANNDVELKEFIKQFK